MAWTGPCEILVAINGQVILIVWVTVSKVTFVNNRVGSVSYERDGRPVPSGNSYGICRIQTRRILNLDIAVYSTKIERLPNDSGSKRDTALQDSWVRSNTILRITFPRPPAYDTWGSLNAIRPTFSRASRIEDPANLCSIEGSVVDTDFIDWTVVEEGSF